MSFKENLLIKACVRGDKETACELIGQGVDVNLVDKNGNTLLMWTCMSGIREIAHKLIEKGAKVNVADEEKNTALMWACAHMMNDIVHELIEKGADVNRVNRWGDTALILACRNGMDEIVHELIEKGADVNVIDSYGDNLLKVVCKAGFKNCINELLKVYQLDNDDIVDYLKMPHMHNENKVLIGKLVEKGADCSRVFDEQNKEYREIFIEGVNTYLEREINRLNIAINEAFNTVCSKEYISILDKIAKDLIRIDDLLRRLERVKANGNLANKFKRIYNNNRLALSNQTIFYMNACRIKAKEYVNRAKVSNISECVSDVGKGLHK